MLAKLKVEIISASSDLSEVEPIYLCIFLKLLSQIQAT